jgi:hypothetical protein
MKKMLVLHEISRFARLLEERSWQAIRDQMDDQMFEGLLDSAEADHNVGKTPRLGVEKDQWDVTDTQIFDPEDVDPSKGQLTKAQRQKITELLGEWEEPPRPHTFEDQVASVGAVMQFRKGLAHLDTDQPFGACFGTTATREECVACSQDLYHRLLLRESQVGHDIHFNAIATLAVNPSSGELDEEKAKELLRIFRPERNGAISLVDFVSSIDAVYKELRLLRKYSCVL